MKQIRVNQFAKVQKLKAFEFKLWQTEKKINLHNKRINTQNSSINFILNYYLDLDWN